MIAASLSYVAPIHIRLRAAGIASAAAFVALVAFATLRHATQPGPPTQGGTAVIPGDWTSTGLPELPPAARGPASATLGRHDSDYWINASRAHNPAQRLTIGDAGPQGTPNTVKGPPGPTGPAGFDGNSRYQVNQQHQSIFGEQDVIARCFEGAVPLDGGPINVGPKVKIIGSHPLSPDQGLGWLVDALDTDVHFNVTVTVEVRCAVTS